MQTMYERDQQDNEGAWRYATEKVCQDVEEFGNWLAWSNDDRQPSAYFASISTAELARVLLTEEATDAQLAAAARELRTRYLADKADCVARMTGAV